MMKAEEVMTKNVATIRGSATSAEAVAVMKQKGLQALVVDRRHEQDAYGIVTETDIIYKVTAFGRDPKAVRVYEIMTKPCVVVNPELGVEYVARLFANTHIHQAPVIKGKLLGLLSITDILTKGDFVERPKAVLLEERIQQEIEQARAVCQKKGPSSEECIAAWDAVEELRAEAAHQQAMKRIKTSRGVYYEKNLEAPEDLFYDAAL